MAEVGLREAAILYGVSEGTMRRRIKRKAVPSRQDSTGRFWVEIPPEVPTPTQSLIETVRGERDRLAAELERAQAREAELQQRLDEVERRRRHEVDVHSEQIANLLALLAKSRVPVSE